MSSFENAAPTVWEEKAKVKMPAAMLQDVVPVTAMLWDVVPVTWSSLTSKVSGWCFCPCNCAIMSGPTNTRYKAAC